MAEESKSGLEDEITNVAAALAIVAAVKAEKVQQAGDSELLDIEFPDDNVIGFFKRGIVNAISSWGDGKPQYIINRLQSYLDGLTKPKLRAVVLNGIEDLTSRVGVAQEAANVITKDFSDVSKEASNSKDLEEPEPEL